MTHDEDQAPQGSFGTGFALGLFMGAAGYYLFGTERGAKLRKQLSEEWDVARVKLAEEGVIEKPDISLREAINDVFQKAFSIKNQILPDRTHRLIAKSGDKNAKKKDVGKKFRGV